MAKRTGSAVGLVYIIGLPALAIGLLYKFRHKLDEANTRIRFGLLYDGYQPKNYMHEIYVVIRKLVIIVIGIFTKKLQIQLALGAVSLLLTHTVLVKPFQTQSLSRLESLLLSCNFFTLWVGSIFLVYPECKAKGGFNNICQTAELTVLFLIFFPWCLE